MAEPTHAGGVVYRAGSSGAPEFLLVTARRSPNDWLFAKGHIEPGETPEAAAVREVAEEAGVTAVVEGRIQPDVERIVGRIRQRVRYYLMTSIKDTGANEGRRSEWLTFEAARARLTFDDLRRVLEQAATDLRRTGDVR